MPSGTETETSTLTGYRLSKLEEIGQAAKDLNGWIQNAETMLQLKAETAPWIADDSLRKFFQKEGSLDQTDRLSAYAGRGLY